MPAGIAASRSDPPAKRSRLPPTVGRNRTRTTTSMLAHVLLPDRRSARDDFRGRSPTSFVYISRHVSMVRRARYRSVPGEPSSRTPERQRPVRTRDCRASEPACPPGPPHTRRTTLRGSDAVHLVTGRRTDRDHRARDVSAGYRVLGPTQPERESEQVRLTGHQMPGPAIETSRVHAHQRLVVGDHGSGDLLELQHISRSVPVLHDGLHRVVCRGRPLDAASHPTVPLGWVHGVTPRTWVIGVEGWRWCGDLH